MANPSITNSIPLRRLIWVSLACWLCFVIERFAYNVFDLGLPYHHVPTMFLWLVLLPFVAYWAVLLRSSWLLSLRRFSRIVALGGVALLLAVGFFYASINVFWTIAGWKGLQWW